jgi:hypothetical protein
MYKELKQNQNSVNCINVPYFWAKQLYLLHLIQLRNTHASYT